MTKKYEKKKKIKIREVVSVIIFSDIRIQSEVRKIVGRGKEFERGRETGASATGVQRKIPERQGQYRGDAEIQLFATNVQVAADGASGFEGGMQETGPASFRGH